MIPMTLNWTTVKIISGIALVAVLVTGGLYIRILRADLAAVKLERDTAQATLAACQNDQKLTEGVSNDYQIKVRSLNRQLADLKRVRDNPRCTPVADPASGRDADTGAGKPAGQDGIRADWLLDFAAEAEQYRLQLMSCQDFIKKTWDSRQ